MKTWVGKGTIEKGGGRSTGLGGGGGMLVLGEPEASSKELELCFRELEPAKEKLDICCY